MEHGVPSLTFFALLLSSGSVAQNAHLVRLDTAALNNISIGEGVPMADGGSVLEVPELGGFSLWKCDAAGTAQWRNRYPWEGAYPTNDIAPTTNGDVLMAYATVNSSTVGDTAIPVLDLWRIGPDGATVWRKHLELDTVFGGWIGFVTQLKIVENEASEIFILSVVDLNWENIVSVTKVDASGAMLWSRRVGDPVNQMSFPFPAGFGSMIYLAPDLSGGCRLVAPATENADESVYIVNVTADGSLAWGRLFDYLGIASSFSMTEPAVDMAGTTLFQTYTSSANGDLHIVRISEAGDLLEVEQYGTGYWGELSYDQGTVLLRGGYQLMVVNDNGDLVSGVGQISLPDDSAYTYQLPLGKCNVKNGRVCCYGRFMSTPVGAGLPLASPALCRFDLSDPAACDRMTFTPVAPHTSLPLSIFTCTPMTSLACDTLAAMVSDGSLTSEPKPLLASVDLCVLTAIAPVAEIPATFTVNRTLLLSGDPLTVTSDRPLGYCILDMKGAVVWSDPRTNQRLDIPTAELTPGLYMLLGRDVTGQVVGTAKVVVGR
jgi:hypothetical protein